jgi:hypothetical protein
MLVELLSQSGHSQGSRRVARDEARIDNPATITVITLGIAPLSAESLNI